MLSIGNTNPYLQLAGVKRQQKADNKQSVQRPAITTPQKAANNASNPSAVNTLEVMALSNLIHNKSFSQEFKGAAASSINSRISDNLKTESANQSGIASKLGSTKSKLSEIKSILSSDSENLSEEEKLIYELIAGALQAELKSFEELLDKSKNAVSSLSFLASFGINQVVKGSHQSSDLLDMLSRSNSEYSSDASSELMLLAGGSADATKKLGRLIQGNQVSLKKTASKAKKEDPEKTALGLDNLYRNVSLSKDNRLIVTQELTNIAVDNPVNGAGQAAASGLENIFKKDSGAVAKNAAVGLRFASIAGNDRATEGLINVASSQTAGKEKNIEAILQLTKVAKSGGNQSQKATDALTGMAQNSSFSGKVKEQLMDSMLEIAAVGGQNGHKALNTLARVASDDRNPHQKKAFSNILKLTNHKTMGNSEVVQSFSDIAQSKRTDPKFKKQAAGKLTEAITAGGKDSGQIAKNALTNIATDPSNKASQQARNDLSKTGMNHLDKSNQDKINIFKKSNLANNQQNMQTKENNGFNPFSDSLPFKFDAFKVAM